MLIFRGTHDTVKINDFKVWSNFNYGLMYNSVGSLVVENSVFADNWISILPIVVGPHPLRYKDYKFI